MPLMTNFELCQVYHYNKKAKILPTLVHLNLALTQGIYRSSII